MSSMRSAALATVALTAGLAVTAAPASADPTGAKNSTPVSITCDGQAYETVANGNGQFSPAHDLNSTSMLIPVAFGPTTFTVTDPDGNVVDSGTEPAEAKGSSAQNPGADMECSFLLTFQDPDGLTITVEGTVTGFVTPAR
jgi:hypothetical protein